MPKTAVEKVYKISSTILGPNKCSLLELCVQLNGAASLILIDSGIHIAMFLDSKFIHNV